MDTEDRIKPSLFRTLIPEQGKRLTKQAKNLQLEVVKQMLTLATTGFGLVAALAWNELIKEFVEVYIKPYLPQGSGVISLIVYAIFVTIMVVLVTVYLSRLKNSLEAKAEAVK